MRLENNDGARSTTVEVFTRESTKQPLWIDPLKFYANVDYIDSRSRPFSAGPKHTRCEENGVSVNTADRPLRVSVRVEQLFFTGYTVRSDAHDMTGIRGSFLSVLAKTNYFKREKINYNGASSGFFCGKQCQHMVPYMCGGRNILSCGIQMNIHFFPQRLCRAERKKNIRKQRLARVFVCSSFVRVTRTCGTVFGETRRRIVDG